MTGSSIAARVQALAEAGDTAAATQLLEDGCAAGDAEALFTLARWKLSGRFVPRDLAASAALFARAADAGQVDAARIHAAFVANGAGGRRDWPRAMALLRTLAGSDEDARSQLAVIMAMDLDEAGDPIRTPALEMLSEAPFVSFCRNLLTPGECGLLIDSALPWLEPAVVIDQTGRTVANPVRTSESAAFPLVLENPAIHAINRRLAAATSTLVEQGEPLQVLRYRPGQEYRPHLDALPATNNQRAATILVYLNDDYEGGETRFVETGLTFKGRTGDALFFRNADENDRPDPMSSHAGLPVTSGEKFLASRWIRTRPIDLNVPLR